MNKVKVAFFPTKKTVSIPAGETIMEAAILAGVSLESTCGGRGTCGKCKVQVMNGVSPPTETEKRRLHAAELEMGYRLACQTRVDSDIAVILPSGSRLANQKVLIEGVERKIDLDPEVKKIYLELEEPSLENQISDWERVKRAINSRLNENKNDNIERHIPSLSSDLGERSNPSSHTSNTPLLTNTEESRRASSPINKIGEVEERIPPPQGEEKEVRFNLQTLRNLPKIVRDSDNKLTAVIVDDQIVEFQCCDTTSDNYGLAFDIGTTTVVGRLLDLNTGEDLAVASAMNPQVIYGDDVVSRINLVTSSKDGLEKLNERVISVVNELIAELVDKSEVGARNIYKMVAVGNTCMHHLFFSLDPTHLALAPYVSVVDEPVKARARELGIKINPCASIYFLPNIAGFVGADTVGVILASAMYESDEIRLAIDIGTNGEIVLGSSKRLISCSTAAGPAFEGAHIKFGMRAADGAIDHIFDGGDDIAITTIGDVPARGICGSGLVDAVAILITKRIIDETGRICDPDDPPEGLSPAWRERIVEGENGSNFILIKKEESQLNEPIVLTQRDVREVQLAKGAILSGIQILKVELGVDDDDIHEVLLAGAFGNYIDRQSARVIGLLPSQIPLERIKSIGNAAGVGAKIALLSKKERERAEQVTQDVEYIELCGHANFQNVFMESMFFPDPDSLA